MLQTIPAIHIFDEPTNKKLTKKERRQLRKQQNPMPNAGLRLKEISPLTDNQRKTFEAYDSNKNLLLTGCPGTGKTFLSVYLSLEEILEDKGPYKKLVIYRSTVSTRDMGFLPGKASDKTKVYETPYHGICSELFGRSDAYDVLKNKGIIEFESTSFIRGITLSDCVVIVDEVQNMTHMEIHSLITRIGKNCKIIFSGDVKQDDLKNKKHKELSGLSDFIKIFEAMKSFAAIEFKPVDIVRGPLVKEYILTRMKLEKEGVIETHVW